MGYPKYPDMRDSEDSWVGNIPSSWKTRRFKLLLESPLQYGANEAALETDRSQPRFVRITDVKPDGTLKEDTFKSLDTELAKPYLLEHEDILLARSGATVGKSFMYQSSWGASAFAGYLIRARVDQSLCLPKFVKYFLNSNSYWSWISASLIQATIQNVSAEKYANLWLPLPTLSEQEQIADFLDHKTRQLDNLIAKKQQLINKLNEKRIALITQAVTKGLDDSVPTKDSGVEWLGKIPQSWEVARLRFLIEGLEQGWSPQCHNHPAGFDKWGVLKVGCVNGNFFNQLENKELPEGLEPRTQYEVSPGDIIISRANTKELLGSAALVEVGVREKLLLCDKLYRFHTNEAIDPVFLLHVLRSSIASSHPKTHPLGTLDLQP